MKQDVESYLGFYAKQFRTPDNESRSKWEQTRRTRVSQPRKIEIRLSALKVQITDAENATAVFRQDYRSDSYRDSVIKELTFIKENGVCGSGRNARSRPVACQKTGSRGLPGDSHGVRVPVATQHASAGPPSAVP